MKADLGEDPPTDVFWASASLPPFREERKSLKDSSCRLALVFTTSYFDKPFDSSTFLSYNLPSLRMDGRRNLQLLPAAGRRWAARTGGKAGSLFYYVYF